jgi:hypothetical protein
MQAWKCGLTALEHVAIMLHSIHGLPSASTNTTEKYVAYIESSYFIAFTKKL